MQSPEDDAGLAGKMGVIGGGEAVGDGIGRAATILLSRAGAKVLIADRASQEH